MLRIILTWLRVIPDPRPVELSPQRQAQLAQLDEMRADIGHLTHEQWLSKWRSPAT